MTLAKADRKYKGRPALPDPVEIAMLAQTMDRRLLRSTLGRKVRRRKNARQQVHVQSLSLCRWIMRP